MNRYCLFDDVATALRRTAEFAAADGEGCEPGSYYVVEVWRKKRPVLIQDTAVSRKPEDMA